MSRTTTVGIAGRLVLEDRVAPGRISLEDGVIAAVELDTGVPADGPFVAPGFVDVHVHGWGGHDAMGGPEALAGMASALARRGVTSFLPTAVSAPLDVLARFAATVRGWSTSAAADGAVPLGLNLEGPFLAPARKGAHDAGALIEPASIDDAAVEPLLDGLRLITIAPELPGAIDLIARLRAAGVAVSLGHSAATLDEARAGYRAGATGTTHLFNAMSGIDHRAPGLAAAALLEDDAFVELIADGHHVHPALWPLIRRAKGPDHLVLVSDAISLAGMGNGRGRLGGLDVEVADGRVTLAGTTTLAGSVIALDDAVRQLVASGVPLPEVVAAAAANPLTLIGQTDRGRIAVGQRADLVELDTDLAIRGVWLAGRRLDA
jgi:N-acetylglucosamine-6-phosphate deacetylase